jgi:purine-binding chemotaxis protein CheW
MTQTDVALEKANLFAGYSDNVTSSNSHQVFTIEVDGNWFGIPIDKVRTVFRTNTITTVPMAQPEIAGLVNVRGEVLTAIYLAAYLGLNKSEFRGSYLLVGIEHRDEDFGLIVDSAGDILDVDAASRILIPATQADAQQLPSMPTYRVGDLLLPLLDIGTMLNTLSKKRP